METDLVGRISPFRTIDSCSRSFGLSFKTTDLNWAGIWAHYGRVATNDSRIELSPSATTMVRNFSTTRLEGLVTINFSRVRDICENFDCGAHISDVVKEIAENKRFRIFSAKEGILISESLRGLYFKQPQAKIMGDEILIILMQPVPDEKFLPRVFSLECDRSILQLCGQYFRSFIDKDTWIAFAPKSQKYLL